MAARAFIRENYGENYVAVGENGKKSNAKIQDAHEAIRPTNISLTPAIVKDSLQRDLFRLYQLIWKRFTASRMQPAVYETTSVKVGAGEYDFTMASSKLSFDGFMSVYVQEEDKEESSAPFGWNWAWPVWFPASISPSRRPTTRRRPWSRRWRSRASDAPAPTRRP